MEFWTKKFTFLSLLNMKGVRLETENTIKNIGWFKLKPFIEDFVFKIFHKKFEDVSKQMLKEWINMSTYREVVKSINDLTNIFPNTSEEGIYSKEYMFGGTPMLDTVNRAALRFNDKKFNDYSKVLFIITDGEYDKELQVKKTITLLKQSKVVVVCGCISDSISKIDFRTEANKKAKQGVQNLIDIASTFDECPELVELIDNGEITVKKENKLCIHINQPDTINAIMNSIIK